MKILFLGDTLQLKGQGGSRKVFFNLAQNFVKEGYEVYLLTTTQEESEENLEVEERDGIKVFRIYVPFYNRRWKPYIGLYNPLAINKVGKIFKLVQPDVVYARAIFQYISYASLKVVAKYSEAVFLSVGSVTLFHYGKLTEFVDHNDLSKTQNFNYRVSIWQQIKRAKKRYNPFRNIIIRYYLKYVDKIIAVSNVLKEAMNQNGIKNVEVIHTGISLEGWSIDEQKIRDFKDKYQLHNKKPVFFGGRLTGLKGGVKLLESMEKVAKEIPEVVLLVAGEKERYGSRMMKKTEGCNVPVIFTGWLEGENLTAAYRVSEVVTMPSLYLEPFGLIAVEGMVCEKPVVASCFGGPSETVVDGKTGYVVNPLNSDEVSEKIIDLLRNPEKAKKLGEAGRERVEEYFNSRRQAKESLDLFYRYTN